MTPIFPLSPRLTLLLRVVFWLALAFTMTMALLPKPPAVMGDMGDKYQHMLAFACLTILASAAYMNARPWKVVLSLSLLGILIELLQAIPALHRDCQFSDWVADTVAILVALAFVVIARRALRI